MSEDKKVEPETTLFRTFSFKGLELRDYFAAKAMQGLLVVDRETRWDIYNCAKARGEE